MSATKVASTQLATTGVTAGTYPSDSAHVPSVTVNAEGQITAASSAAIAVNASAISSGILGTARGGTGSDLSSTGGSGQYVKQSSSGSGLSVGAISAGDLPAATTSAQGAVQLATNGGTSASTAVQGNDTRLKRRAVIQFCAAYSPASAGADTAEFEVPYGTDQNSITWNVKRIFFRVQTAGGAPQVTIEYYNGTSSFTATTVGSVTLGSGANEGSQTSSFTTSQLTSGYKVRMNANTLGSASNWSVKMELQEN